MFGNFIIFIVALLVYATYQPVETPRFGPGTTVFLFILLVFVFTAWAGRYFRTITGALTKGTIPGLLAPRFDAGIKRFTIYALVMLGIDIYGLNLPDYARLIPLFQTIPTLEAIIFLAIFMGYMTITWYIAWVPQQRLFPGIVSRSAYIRGQIAFNLPVLIPWLTLSALLDLIFILPFESLKNFLNTTHGQAIYFIVFLFFAAILAPVIVKIFWNCQPLPAGPDRHRIERLCRRTGVTFAGILRWPLFGGRMITAGVMGLVGRFRYLLVTDSLLRLLSPEEIDTVIAHELGHVKKKHLLFYLFFLGGYVLLSLSILDLIIFFIIYSQPAAWLMETTGLERVDAATVFFSVATIVMFILYFRYIFGFFMRNFERQADTYVYTLFHSAQPLISTLKKIAFASGQSANKPNWHHFSIAERIDYLEKCEMDRRWVIRQDRKIQKGMGLFLMSTLLVGVIGYQINFGDIGRRLNHTFFENILLGEIDKNPDQFELYRTLGSLYYEKKQWRQAILYYTRTLDLAPQDPETLNNLAWLYATCEDDALQDPPAALRLAKRAAAIKPEAHVLDTLAESYFVNGQIDEAVRVAQLANDAARSNRSYYKDQLSRFRKAASGKIE